MRIKKNGWWVLAYESVGFIVIIGLCWIDEIEGASQVLFGGKPHVHDWRDCAMQTLAVVYIWAIVCGLTKKLLDHLRYLEGFVRICAWCRKVGHKDKWVRMEQYFADGLHLQTTHGVCPECLKKVGEDTKEYRRRELDAGKPAPAGDSKQA